MSPRFEDTSTELLGRVRSGDSDALNELCDRYWYPLYTWLIVRGVARTPSDAEDYVQGFFEKMLSRGEFQKPRDGRGAFRNFLIKCLKNYVIDQARKKKIALAPLADGDSEPLENIESSERADAAFKKAWAWTVFESAKSQIQRIWQGEGRGDLFEALSPYLEGDVNPEGLEALGRRFGFSHGNIRVQLYRLRKDLRQKLHILIVADLPDDATPEEQESERRFFLEALIL